MSPTKSGDSILRKIAFAFLFIIALVWLAELIRLPHLVLGEPPVFLWWRVIFRTLIMLAIWYWMHRTTARLLRRLHELEEFLRVCSWCRKVDHQGSWLTLEEFFGSNFATRTSHGICPECIQKARADLRAMAVQPGQPADPA